MTKVINLFGGSGIGKSTTASKVFGAMKDKKYNVELVREYIKEWCWAKRPINEFTQPISYGVQLERESQLYGQVDYIITDSPLLLYPVYQHYNYGHDSMSQQVLSDYIVAQDMGVDHINFVLKRSKEFDTRGRFETEEQAIEVDCLVKQYLDKYEINYCNVDVSDEKRVQFIMDYLEMLDS